MKDWSLAFVAALCCVAGTIAIVKVAIMLM
jgi:hypothetical protein